MSRTELEHQIWTICMRLGSINGQLHNVRCGTKKESKALPYKLIMLINQNFNDLYEVERFFAPVNKSKNENQFKFMLNNIAPFKGSDILVEGTFFTVSDRDIYVQTSEYKD